MAGSSPHQRGRSGDQRRIVALRASSLMEESLRANLPRDSVEFVALEPVVENPSSSADLVVCEPGEDLDPLVSKLLSATHLADAPVMFIGPPESGLVDPRRPVHQLSADVSVSEVLRLARRLLFSSGSIFPENRSQPSAPVSFFPRRGERSPSQPTPPVHSQPAPLIPSSGPPSSKPHGRPRQLPTIPPTLAGRPSDELIAPPSELSDELSQLLNDVEGRVARQLRPQPSVPADSSNAPPFEMTPEVEAALADPIGDMSRDEEPGSNVDNDIVTGSARSTGVPKTGSGYAVSPASHTFSAATTRGAAPAHPGEASGSAPPETEALPPLGSLSDSAPPESFSPRVTPTVGTHRPNTARPPSSFRGTEADEPGATPLPPDPAVPKDMWTGLEGRRPEWDGSALSTGSATTDAGSEADEHSERFPRRPLQSDKPRNSNPPEPAGAVKTRRPPGLKGRSSAPAPEIASRVEAESEAPSVQHTDGYLPLDDDPEPHPDSGAAPTPQPPGRRIADGARPYAAEPLAAPAGAQKFGPSVNLGADAAVGALAKAVRTRQTGVLEYESSGIIRRIVLRDGDLVTAASSATDESLVAFLVSTGVLSQRVGEHLGHRLPSFGRHASAALIAGGHLPQNELWPTLRSHAEFIVAGVLRLTEGVAGFETTVPERLRTEPSVFGGATGSEVLVEILKRTLDPDTALTRLGGLTTRLDAGTSFRLLDECALSPDEQRTLQASLTRPVEDWLSRAPSSEFACVLYALSQLEVLQCHKARPATAIQERQKARDRFDDEAVRQAILTRRALVDEADYFTLLGVSRNATGYDVRRAYLDLRRTFEPSKILTNATLDLRDDVDLILEVVEEAYGILKDNQRRERYRRAIESIPA